MAKKATATKKEVETVINSYELMLILSPDLRESEVKKKLKEIEGMIEKAGGKITNEDFWGKKDLAYRLKKYWEGLYMVYNLELPNTFLNELKDHLRIEKDLLRYLILKLPSDYTYTKYELEVEEEPKREIKKKKVSIKKVEPVVPIKKEEEKPAPVEEKPVEPIEEAPVEEEVAPEVPVEEIKEEEEEKEEEVPVEEEKEEKEAKEEAPVEEEKPVEEVAAEEKEEEEKEEEAPVEEEKPAEEEKEEEKEAKEEEPAPPTEEEKEEEEKKKKEYESELDRKLDEILGGEDLNL